MSARLAPVLVLAAAALGVAGWASCGLGGTADGDPEASDGGAEAGRDGDVDRDGGSEGDGGRREDAEAPGRDADPERDGDGADSDRSTLPPPWPLDPIEVPRDREGLDCGPGCRQVSFAFPVATFWGTDYAVSDRFVAYKGAYRYAGGVDDVRIFLVDLETETEYQLLDCAGSHCTAPAVDGETVVLGTKPKTSWYDWTIWTYRVGEPEMVPLVRRWVTQYGRPVKFLSLEGDTLAWYDSAVAPAGIYTMSVSGGELTDLTDLRCICYLYPQVRGRQVLYEGFQTYWHNPWVVDLDTLEHRNLTRGTSDQFFPAWDGHWVAWIDTRNDDRSPDPYIEPHNSDIYGMELPGGAELPLCTDPSIQYRPSVGGGVVVWEDYRNAADPNDFRAEDPNIDIYVLDLGTMAESQLTSLPGPEIMPRVHGRRVYFVAPDLIGRRSIFVIDLDEAGRAR